MDRDEDSLFLSWQDMYEQHADSEPGVSHEEMDIDSLACASGEFWKNQQETVGPDGCSIDDSLEDKGEWSMYPSYAVMLKEDYGQAPCGLYGERAASVHHALSGEVPAAMNSPILEELTRTAPGYRDYLRLMAKGEAEGFEGRQLLYLTHHAYEGALFERFPQVDASERGEELRFVLNEFSRQVSWEGTKSPEWGISYSSRLLSTYATLQELDDLIEQDKWPADGQ